MKTLSATVRFHLRPFKNVAAFTLLELMVIIGIIALLLILIVPSFSQTSSQAKSFQCMANMHCLTAAWRMFAVENSDKFVRNNEIPIGSDAFRWVDYWLDWTTGSANTNQALLRASPLGTYLNSDTAVFRCPADTYLSRNQQTLNWPSRNRSVSMNMFVGPRASDEQPKNDWYPAYRQWIKLAEIPDPANVFIFIDEHPDSINGAVFVVNPTQTNGPWIDIPGSLHNGGANLSFADEHVETHRWQSYSTKTPVIFNYLAPAFDNLGQSDHQWLRARAAIPFQ